MNLNIVLYQPEIPQNTGNIGRTCVLTNSTLHLIKPFGFSFEDKYLKRSGMDYWHLVNYICYDSFEEFYEKNKNNRIYLSTTKTDKLYTDVSYRSGDFVLFGKESAGVPEYIREILEETSIKVPMLESSDRSLNLSNTVAIVAYEALRQVGFPGMK